MKIENTIRTVWQFTSFKNGIWWSRSTFIYPSSSNTPSSNVHCVEKPHILQKTGREGRPFYHEWDNGWEKCGHFETCVLQSCNGNETKTREMQRLMIHLSTWYRSSKPRNNGQNRKQVVPRLVIGHDPWFERFILPVFVSWILLLLQYLQFAWGSISWNCLNFITCTLPRCFRAYKWLWKRLRLWKIMKLLLLINANMNYKSSLSNNHYYEPSIHMRHTNMLESWLTEFEFVWAVWSRT